MKSRKSRITIILFGVVMAAWLGLPGMVLDENTRNLQDAENETRSMYTFNAQIVEDSDDFEITNYKKINRNVEEKNEEDELLEEKDVEEELSIEIVNTNRPVMHTFYEETPNGCCGMTNEGHRNLLKTWGKSWEERGWDTRILTKEDAMKHPDFKMLEEKLIALRVGPYNRRCYWRWLAMASVEDGGWMSDYDVFPLQLSGERGNEIAQDGTFKSFALHVPCLIHASRAEWDRIIHLMIDELPNQTGIVSDMYSLMNLDIVRGRSKMQWSNQVAPSFIYSSSPENELHIDCGKGNKLAIHLSHSECDAAFKHGRYPLTDIKGSHEAVRKRGEAAIVLMNDYNNECIEDT